MDRIKLGRSWARTGKNIYWAICFYFRISGIVSATVSVYNAPLMHLMAGSETLISSSLVGWVSSALSLEVLQLSFPAHAQCNWRWLCGNCIYVNDSWATASLIQQTFSAASTRGMLREVDDELLWTVSAICYSRILLSCCVNKYISTQRADFRFDHS